MSGFAQLRLLEAKDIKDFAQRPLPEEKPTTEEFVEIPVSGKAAGDLASGRYAFGEYCRSLVGDYPRLTFLQEVLWELQDSTDGKRDFEELCKAVRKDVFCAEVCAKLTGDFDKYEFHIGELHRGRLVDLYADIRDAFRFGADEGCVVFH